MKERLKFDLTTLAEEILDQIPETLFVSSTTTFMDPAMGGGQFLKAVISRLRKYGHGDKNISTRVFGYESNKMRVNFAKKQCEYIGVFEAKNFLEEDMSKKFDVIVGNPPYNGSNNGNIPIYHKFVRKSQELADQVLMIIPSSFAMSNERNGSEVRQLVGTKQTEFIKFLSSDIFKTADVETLYFIWKKGSTNKTRIINSDDEEHFTTNYTYIWRNKKVKSILEKCGTDESKDGWIKFYRIEKSKLCDKETNTVTTINKDKVEITKTTTVDRYVNHYRVVTSFLPNSPNHLDVVHVVEPGVSVKDGYTVSLCSSKEEAENLSKYLKCNLVLFIFNKTKTSRTLRSPQLKFIPKVPLDRLWTDKELYEYFGLTKEEIDYIEANIK